MADQVVATPSVRQLPVIQRLCYGVGHTLNDLCASMWFSYLLLYFHRVENFSNIMAGMLLLVGQVADAICTPFVGFETDRTNGCCGYGKRKSWHLIGTLCVIASFPFIFISVIGSPRPADWAKFIYYAPFVIIFQFGWAATQISHLSLIPDLTPNESERVGLNSIRYTFTVLSNCTVYLITWLMLGIQGGQNNKLQRKDAPLFMYIALIVVGIGTVFSCIFHVGTRERRGSQWHESNSIDSRTGCYKLKPKSDGCHMTWHDWFKEHQFYQVALLYMCTRLVVNVGQIYLPMYLTDTLNADKVDIAIVPFVIYLSGFVSSFLMKPLNRIVGRKLTYFIGIVAIVGASTWFYFIDTGHKLLVFGPAVLQGIGSTTILITSLSMTADLIGEHVESGAFVYGAMSFTDKLSNGCAVMLIQLLNPCKACCSHCGEYFRNVLAFVPGSIALASFVVLLTLVFQRLGHLRKAGKVQLENCDRVSINEDSSITAPLLSDSSRDSPYHYTNPTQNSNTSDRLPITYDSDINTISNNVHDQNAIIKT